MSRFANTLSCVSCGYELSHADQSARTFCPRCREERAFVLKVGSTTSFGGREDFTVVSVYGREQALRDGDLVDVSGEARNYGFRSLVTLTKGVWEHYVAGKPDEQRALRAFLHSIKGSVHVIVRLVLQDSSKEPRLDAEVGDRVVRIVLTMDEGGKPDVRVMFPEEE
jgi:phage FluMu protein Com